MRKHKVWCHNRICKLILGVEVHQPAFVHFRVTLHVWIHRLSNYFHFPLYRNICEPTIHSPRPPTVQASVHVDTSTDCCKCSTLALCPVLCWISCWEQFIAEQNVCFSPAAAAAHHINSISLGEKHRDLQMCYRVLLGMTA